MNKTGLHTKLSDFAHRMVGCFKFINERMIPKTSLFA